jgi:hypothetical protein
MRSIRYFFICIFLTGFISTKCFAQFTVNDFLRSANTDPVLKVIDDQASFIQQKTYSMNLVNRLQFRSQNNEGLNKDTQRWGLWMSPENPWAIINNNQYFKTYAESLIYQREVALKKALKERYLLIIDFFYFSELKSLHQREKDLMDAQLTVLENQRSSDFFNASSFADLKLQQIAKSVEVEETLFEMENQVVKIDTKYTDAYIKEVDWNYNELITLDQISVVVDSIALSETVSSLLKYEDSRIEVAKASYRIQKSNINTGFIQGNYLHGNLAKNKTPWSFVAGVTIPIFNPNKGDMARKQLNVIEAENKKIISQMIITNERTIAVDKLKNLLARYKDTQTKIEALDINAVGATLSSMSNNNPVVVIKLNSSALKLEGLLLRIKQNILIAYVELLDVHDRLQQRPLINYLSAGLRKIDGD